MQFIISFQQTVIFVLVFRVSIEAYFLLPTLFLNFILSCIYYA